MVYSSERHWAAVRIQRSAMSVPAHTNSYRPFRQYLICATQAQEPGTEGRPAAIFKLTSLISPICSKVNSSFSLVSFLSDSSLIEVLMTGRRSNPFPRLVVVIPHDATGLYWSFSDETDRRNLDGRGPFENRRRGPNLLRSWSRILPFPINGLIAGLPQVPA